MTVRRSSKQKTPTKKASLLSQAVPPPSPATARTPARRDEFLTPTEVADRLLVAPVTVRLWATKGLLPSVTTLGGHRRFRAEDIEAFVARHQRHANRQARPSRVLIIDDDPQYSRLLTRLIMKQAPGVAVEVANDGFSAGVKCEASRPDIVTLDLHMPNMDGYEVCQLLRAMNGPGKLRIVALTGFATKKNVERILAAGADACLKKTVAADVLLRELGLLQTPA